MRSGGRPLDVRLVDVPTPTSPEPGRPAVRVVAVLAHPRLRDEVLRAAEALPALSVELAQSVAHAVELLRHERPDAVLVEIVNPMADLRGLSELVVRAGGEPAPLLLTGRADRALVDALRRAGFFARAVPEGRDAAAICGALLEMSCER